MKKQTISVEQVYGRHDLDSNDVKNWSSKETLAGLAILELCGENIFNKSDDAITLIVSEQQQFNEFVTYMNSVDDGPSVNATHSDLKSLVRKLHCIDQNDSVTAQQQQFNKMATDTQIVLAFSVGQLRTLKQYIELVAEAFTKRTYRAMSNPQKQEVKIPPMTARANNEVRQTCFAILDEFCKLIPFDNLPMALLNPNRSRVSDQPIINFFAPAPDTKRSMLGWEVWNTKVADLYVATLPLQASNIVNAVHLGNEITQTFNKKEIAAKLKRNRTTSHQTVVICFKLPALEALNRMGACKELGKTIFEICYQHLGYAAESSAGT